MKIQEELKELREMQIKNCRNTTVQSLQIGINKCNTILLDIIERLEPVEAEPVKKEPKKAKKKVKKKAEKRSKKKKKTQKKKAS